MEFIMSEPLPLETEQVWIVQEHPDTGQFRFSQVSVVVTEKRVAIRGSGWGWFGGCRYLLRTDPQLCTTKPAALELFLGRIEKKHASAKAVLKHATEELERRQAWASVLSFTVVRESEQ
jgi:hypothetical protein